MAAAGGTPMSRRSTVILLAAGAVVVGVGIGLGVGLGTRSSAQQRLPVRSITDRTLSAARLQAQAVWPAKTRRAPGFLLRDQHQRLFPLQSQRGHVVFLTFLNSYCKQACPFEGRQLAQIQRMFPHAFRPTLIVVSVNPRGDTITSTNSAARRWRFATPWYWLRGQKLQLERIWRTYNIEVQPKQGDIAHGTAVYVLDRHGYERAGYEFPFSTPGVATAVRALERSD